MAQLLVDREILLQSSRTRPSPTTPVVWLNLVCLDAPIVAVTWQWLFARNFHLSLSIAERVSLFLTAWLIYLADRFADVWNLSPVDAQSLRQRFCRAHWRGWIVLCIAVGLADSWIVLRLLDAETIRGGIVVGAIAVVYLTINHWLGKVWRFLPVKEICVGSLFALGTITSLVARHAFSPQFASTFVLFAALCSLNCISIAVWERDLDLMQRKNSIATRWTGAGFSLRAGVVAVTLLAASFSMGGNSGIYACIASSAMLLLILDLLGWKNARDQRTASADLVLLTPLVLLAFGIV